MREFIADLHIHSKYSRGASADMTLDEIARTAKTKGIAVLGTGDFTHSAWLAQLGEMLRIARDGIFEFQGTHFVLTAEVSAVFSRAGKIRRIHHLLAAPSFEAVELIRRKLAPYGDLDADGCPTLKLEAARLTEIVLGADARCLVIPAHIWSRDGSLFGAGSGFDSLEECYGPESERIAALETGVESDPEMNWRCSALDGFTMLSSSDARALDEIGREASAFACPLEYDALRDAILSADPARFCYTLEAAAERFPDYAGVLNRLERLADRPDGAKSPRAIPFRRIVPLKEVVVQALGVARRSQRAQQEYDNLIRSCGPELHVLLDAPEELLRRAASAAVVDGLLRMRAGRFSAVEEPADVQPTLF